MISELKDAEWFLDVVAAETEESDWRKYDKALSRLSSVDRVAFAILTLSDTLASVGADLGMRDAATPMGAIESLGKAVIDGATTIGGAIECGEALTDGLNTIAGAIQSGLVEGAKDIADAVQGVEVP